ncbi:Hypothetical predicted protein, partial [Paramuricea clavata]
VVSVAEKRLCVPEGNTLGKPPAKVRTWTESEASHKRCLFGKDNISTEKSKWTTSKDSAIVQYICLYWEYAHKNKWPTMKNPHFWDGCAQAVMNICKTMRTGESKYFFYVSE